MLARSWFDALKYRFTRKLNRQERRASGRRGPPTRLLKVETLEDRRVLAFAAAVNYDSGTNPQAIVSADFNNDGRLDLATANASSNDVSVLLGNAGGTFQAAQNSPTGSGPLSVAVGDFNADGKLDLATVVAGGVSVLLGNGLGSFGAATNIGVDGYKSSLAVGDFNADGNLDLGVTSNVYVFDGYGYYGGRYYHYEGRANVLLGTGTGSFSAPIAYSLGNGNHSSAAVADFNGDGKQDFASANHDYGTVDVLLGTGTGTFGAPTGFGAGSYPGSVAAGDVNGDGKFDLVTANLYGNNVSVLLGNGLGSFGAAQYYAAGSQPRSVALADFNGDGKVDLATANGDTGTVSVLLGTGTGSFKPPVSVSAGSYPLEVAVGNFNGVGGPDVASANSGSSNVSVLLNNGIWPALDAPSITINDVTVTEGNTGTTSATFTVSLSAAYGQPMSVHYSTADGSATAAGGDYQAASGTLTFAPGVTSQTVTVLVNGDRVAEYSESFSLLLTDPTNALVADATGVGTILDDEPHVSIEYGPVVVTEGNTGTTSALFTVRLAAPYDAPVSVNLSTVEGDTDFPYWGYYGYYEGPPSATSNVDFQAAAATLTFAPGETVKTIPIAINGDRLGEPDEYFSVNLGTSPSGATIDGAHAVGIIVNDEPYASIGGGGIVVEGNSGTKAMTFTVTLSAPSDAPVTVDFATADGSATTASGDYQAKTDTLTFGIGQTSKTITVLVNGDRLGEYDEYFYVNLTGATGALISNGTGYGTIQDDEPRLSINSVSLKEGQSGTSLMTFTVTLSAAYDQTVTVNYATHDSSATAGSDYVAASGTLTFAPGQTTKTFTVSIKGDKQKEANESFYVLLSGASSNALIYNAYGWGTILNDDPGNGNGKAR